MKKQDKSEFIEQLKSGTLSRDFSGKLSYEIKNYPSELYSSKKKELAKEFGLISFGFSINGPDEAFQSFIKVKGFNRVGVE